MSPQEVGVIGTHLARPHGPRRPLPRGAPGPLGDVDSATRTMNCAEKGGEFNWSMQHLLPCLITQEMVQMTEMRRRGLSALQKQEVWARWKRGQSLNEVARALAKHRVRVSSALRLGPDAELCETV